MAVKLPELKWNVAYMSWDEKKLKTENIWDHDYFFNDCARDFRKHGEDRKMFLELVRRNLMYYFWAKCEWEFIVSSWPPNDSIQEAKVDVYDQIMLNWDRFADYVWENRAAFRRRKKR